jgi:hypothetical protein
MRPWVLLLSSLSQLLFSLLGLRGNKTGEDKSRAEDGEEEEEQEQEQEQEGGAT